MRLARRHLVGIKRGERGDHQRASASSVALAGGACGAANSGKSSKPFGVARSSASSLASTSRARSITLAGSPASFATWMP